METINLTYREFIMMFLKFLKEEHIYKEYVTNLKNTHKASLRTFENHINPLTLMEFEVFENGYYSEMINYAFMWNRTPQGHVFWSTYHQKWQKKFINKEIKLINEKL